MTGEARQGAGALAPADPLLSSARPSPSPSAALTPSAASTAADAPSSPDPQAELAVRLGHEFVDASLLDLALTHRSFCAEHPGHVSNERLEFLGDAVLGLVVTDHIFASYPGMPEGELAKLRAAVVSASTLAEVARELDVGAGMRLGKGEAASGGAEKRSILADAIEAIFGAVYLDGGMPAVRPVVLALLHDRIALAADGPGGQDFKTRLQELAARHYEALPSYQLSDEGPDHEKRFFATVFLDGQAHGSGEGPSKKQAEQAAAHAAWLHLVARFETAGERRPAGVSARDGEPETGGEPDPDGGAALGPDAGPPEVTRPSGEERSTCA